ncbi:MAG: DsbA family protein [Trueperaceae bacterium]|nr:DsbA family protein [Trueperaceae bacterium]
METVTVYFDYLCPYAKRGMELASLIQEPLELNFDWKHYSLAQGNYRGEDDWQLWQDSLSKDDRAGGKGLLPFLASYAARRQGDDFTNFRLKMFKSYHDERKPYSLENILATAQEAGLELERFEQDLQSDAARASLAEEHSEAVARDISATPTFCFDSGAAAYFRFKSLPETAHEASQFFLDYRKMLERYPDLETIRRPYKRR